MPPPPGPDDDSVGLVAELAELYVWGFPLVVMHRTSAGQLASVGPVLDRADLATATSRSVVAPNNDTLYSSRWFDLRGGDLVIEVPRFDDPDRYWSVMLLDAYTHVQYVSRRTHGRDGTSVRVALAAVASADPQVVSVATPTVWVLVRVLVGGPDDLDAARVAQRSISVHQDGAGEPPPLVDRSSFFADLVTAVAIDPPVPGQAPPPAGAIARLADLVADPTAVDVLTQAEATGKELLAGAGTGADTFGNGWGTRQRGADFGADATYRAAFARVSLAGHLPAENRGYNAPVDGRTTTTLRFPPGDEPPVDGFWSLTLYGPDLFFVDNPIDRFSIGDRTAGLTRDADGGLTITISNVEPPSPANWLPAPDGPAVVVLRCYEGAPSIVDATWFPPALTAAEPGTAAS